MNFVLIALTCFINVVMFVTIIIMIKLLHTKCCMMHQRSCTNLLKFIDSVTKCIMCDGSYKTYNKNYYRNCDKSCEAEQTTALIAVHVMLGSMRRGLHF